MSTKKFKTLFEAAMNRYQRSGFLYGDRVEFVDNYKSHDEYKDLGQNVKDMLDQMVNSGLHIRVTDIKNKYPSITAANSTQSTGQVFLDIALDSGGGRYTHLCTIPSCLVKHIDDGHNLPPIPDAFRRKNKFTFKPEELEQDEEHITRKTDRGSGKLTPTELSLPKSNTKLPSEPASKDPAINAYVKALAK